ncbi:alcohol dehydrogenase catalytic domain-containing protein [uncultured Acetobacterium sp.]|uniref:alcohol dehydrogenase catalytic domain-containing protein n=1 Tax=uncultured Acetobacterium sp. TaxID=217139 RepID=UPI0025FDED7B|nr:alcohol dehydrogenase catalytic domain-containing protein [uncultured Acetobacterium sp.]
MKAVVLEKPGELVLRELEMPVCGASELLVRVRACNICRTDLKCATVGQRDLVYPRVLGHEIAGEIIAKGSQVARHRVGQRVHIHPGISCGKCQYCKKGQDNLCDQIKIMGFNFDGGFQEIIKIDQKALRSKVVNLINSKYLTYEEITFIEPLACCVNIQDRLKMNYDSVLVIIGGGRLGLLNLFLAKAERVTKVILIEENEGRRNRGKALGFDAVFSGREPDLLNQLKRCTNNRGVDVVIPCCPEPAALDLAVQILRKRGTLGYFSGITKGQDAYPDINQIHYKEISVVGSYGCSVGHSRKAKAFLESKKVYVKPLISRRVELEDLATGMDYLRNGDGYSTIVVMNK